MITARRRAALLLVVACTLLKETTTKTTTTSSSSYFVGGAFGTHCGGCVVAFVGGRGGGSSSIAPPSRKAADNFDKSRDGVLGRRNIQESCLSSSFVADTEALALVPLHKKDDNKVIELPLSREEAQAVMEKELFPSAESYIRDVAGRKNMGVEVGEPVAAQDPRTKLTYGEFPLASFDALVDRAVELWLENNDAPGKEFQLMDLGSGCGRLVLYAALTRGSKSSEDSSSSSSPLSNFPCHVHGIEIGAELHHLALESLERATEYGWFLPNEETTPCSSRVWLHHGAAQEFPHLFANCQVIFAYCTVWDTIGWDPNVGALLIGAEWSQFLAQVCPPQSIVVTTDRVLDPQYGWQILDRFEVENPEVLGSQGFIQILRSSP